MIRALEEHLEAWAAAELDRLAGESGLFGGAVIRSRASGLRLSATVTRLIPEPDRQGLSVRSSTEGPSLAARAQMLLQVSGPKSPMDTASDRQLSPDGASIHEVDLAALTLLALLQEQSVPGPDGGGSKGVRPEGQVIVTQAGRGARLSWGAFTVGEPVLSAAGRNRQWEIPLSATVSFRLSPAPLEGGRIRRVQAKQELSTVLDGVE